MLFFFRIDHPTEEIEIEKKGTAPKKLWRKRQRGRIYDLERMWSVSFSPLSFFLSLWTLFGPQNVPGTRRNVPYSYLALASIDPSNSSDYNSRDVF